MNAFDPWTASLEQAEAQPNAHDPQGAISQWHSAQKLTAGRELIPKDGYAVLWAVAECAMNDLVMPDWLARAYLTRFRAVAHFFADSWDSEKSFGKPYPKGTQMSAKRRQRVNLIKVSLAVANAIDRDPERAIDAGFWEEIGKGVGEGKTNAQKLHSKAVRCGFAVPPSERKGKLLSNH